MTDPVIVTDWWTARELGADPEAHAEPREDREPKKRGIPPLPMPEPVRVQAPDVTTFPPEAVETWRRLQDEERRRNRVGALRANVVGVNEDGEKPEGATDSLCRNLSAMPVRGHDEMAITLGGEVFFTQAPAVHVPGAEYATADGKLPRDVKAILRHGRIVEAQRYEHRAAMLHAADDAAGLAPWEVAERVGVTRAKATRANRGHSRRKP